MKKFNTFKMKSIKQKRIKISPAIFNDVNVIFICTDSRGRAVSCNSKTIEIFGAQSNKFLGRSVANLLYHKGASRGKSNTFKIILDNCLRYKTANNFSDIIYGSDGIERFIIWHITPYSAGLKAEKGVFLVGFEVTSLKHPSEGCSELKENDSSPKICQLVSALRHEIYNCLFIISGRLELMLCQEGLTQKITQDLNTAVAQIEKIKWFIEGLHKYVLEFAEDEKKSIGG